MAVPKKIPFPSNMAPASMVVDLRFNTQAHFSQFTGIAQTVENVGAVWMFNLDYAGLEDYQIEPILSAITRLRGMAGRLLCYNFSRPRTTGNLDTSNKVENYNFLLGGSGWSEIGTISYYGNKARLKRDASSAYLRQVLTLEAGKTYSLSFSLTSGSYEMAQIHAGTSALGTELGTISVSKMGRHDLVFTAAATTHITIKTNGGVSGDFLFVTDIVCARCAETDGASQVGSVIDVDGLDINDDEAIRPLDFVKIGSELKRVVEVVHTDGTGKAKLIIEPPMFAAVADNSPVILNRPHGKFLLNTNVIGQSIEAPVISSTSIQLTEDLSNV